MSTPGGIEFNKDIFSGIFNNFIEFFSNKNIDGFILSGGDFFRFESRG